MNGTGTTKPVMQPRTMRLDALDTRLIRYAKAHMRTQGDRGPSLTSSYERYCLNMHHEHNEQQHLKGPKQDTEQHIHDAQRNTSHTHVTAVA